MISVNPGKFNFTQVLQVSKNPRGMALVIVLGVLFAIGILAFSLHYFSRSQRFQSFQLSCGEIAHHAAEFGARQGYLLVQRSADFLNSTSSDTFPKKTKAPKALKEFIDGFVNDEGRLVDSSTFADISVPLAANSLFADLGNSLSLKVTIQLDNQKPLFATPPFPGLLESSSESKGRFVVDSLASYQGVQRRMVAVFEQRTISMTWPVAGRFVLMASDLAGELNPVMITLQPQTQIRIPLPFVDSGSPAPFVVMGGPGITDAKRSTIQQDPAGFLDRQGWISLCPSSSGDPRFWTFNISPEKDDGEHFAIGEDRVYYYDITQGTNVLGRQVSLPNGGSYQFWNTHQIYVYLTGLYKESRESARYFFLEKESSETQKSSLLRLFGANALPSPTLVFGKVYRRFLLEQGLRRKASPSANRSDSSISAPFPFIQHADFSSGNWGRGMDVFTAQVLRDACGASFQGYQEIMSQVMDGVYNDGVAFWFDARPSTLPNRPMQPLFQTATIPKLGKNLVYQSNKPDSLLLDGKTAIYREGKKVYEGELQEVLPCLGIIALTRCGWSFPSGSELKKSLQEIINRDQSTTGYYLVEGPFEWTDDFNRLALGGVTIVAKDSVTIRAGVKPQSKPQIPDASQNCISLVSLNGNIVIDTAEPIHAALIAPNGGLDVSRPVDFTIHGFAGVKRLTLSGMLNSSIKLLVYNPVFDWAEGNSFRQSFRIMLEQLPQVFVAKPK